jgi:hypothetical protein
MISCRGVVGKRKWLLGPNPAGSSHQHVVVGSHLDVVEDNQVAETDGQELLRFFLVDAFDFHHDSLSLLSFSSVSLPVLGSASEEQHAKGVLLAEKASDSLDGKVREKRPLVSSHILLFETAERAKVLRLLRGRKDIMRVGRGAFFCLSVIEVIGLQRYVSPDFWLEVYLKVVVTLRCVELLHGAIHGEQLLALQSLIVRTLSREHRRRCYRACASCFKRGPQVLRVKGKKDAPPP